ncbi:hypothetical protein [Candidatus Harpocratesius sp.]
MLFLIDTCFWLHIQHILLEIKIDLRDVLRHFRWGYTKQIVEEYHNYHLQKFIPIEDGFRIPLSQKEIISFQKQFPFINEFDLPDQTLAFCAKRDGAILLSDDGGLLMEIKSWGLVGFRLPSFCIWLIQSGYIRKNIGAQLLRFWEKNGLYQKREIKRWKKALQHIT